MGNIGTSAVVTVLQVAKKDELAEELGKMLAAARESARGGRGIKQAEAAAHVGVEEPYISGIENGRVPAAETLIKLVDYYDVDAQPFLRKLAEIELSKPKHHPRLVEALATKPANERPKSARPVVMRVSAGPLLEREEEPTSAQEWIPVERSWSREPDAFWVIADGESMTGAGIEDGDRVLIEPRVQPKDGDLAIVWLDGELTLKRWQLADHSGPGLPFVYLQPANDKFKPRPIKKSEWLQKRGIAARVAGWLPGFRRAR